MDYEAIVDELLQVFHRHHLSVAGGLLPGGKGIALRSQDERVDLSNLAEVIPQPLTKPYDAVQKARDEAMRVFNDSALMPGNEKAMEEALEKLMDAVEENAWAQRD